MTTETDKILVPEEQSGAPESTADTQETTPVAAQVLLVDDEADILEFISYNLIREGYQGYTATNGKEAVAKAREVVPHLILLDVMMPDMDGIAMCRRIRETNNIPIIMVSAKTQDIDKIVGLSTGADDYVAKPFNPLELTARVKSLLRRYTQLGAIAENKPAVFRIGGQSN